jgi:LysR family transcriptional activator of glutamate synthase operon
MVTIEKRLWFMTLHQLKIFEAVAEHLNITEASRKVRVSQPSVTKQLRLLEREWGLKLYVKNGRGIRLTEEGRLFRIAVRPIVEQTEELKRTFAKRVAEARTENLLVGSTPSAATSVLPAALKAFVEIRPNVHPTLRTGYPPAMEEMILNGEVEIALTTSLPNHSQIVSEAIHSEDIVAVVSAKHPFARKRKLNEAELLKAPFVMTKDGRIAEELEKLRLRLNVVMWCESIDLKKAAVEAGLGVGLFYRGSAEAGLREGYFKLIEIPRVKEIKITCFVIHRKGINLSSNGRDLLTILRRCRKQAVE